ncbi:hypothetical protein GE061_009536 [Apolygus lucorum]|uniref:AAA+ ATPase domain-containing protein n=1 Tax=Apolygus lucorum TaxID=248454 RepID=A0A8S9Y0T7_APOLU|nr:hypothetical protein GE061_009536 [Apolygus lucorum]
MELVASHAYNLYMTEITKLRDLYNKRRRNPGIPKLIAPVAARLIWIQALTSRITQPLEVMKSCKIDSSLPWTPTGIKIFNALLKTFCLFEMIHREVVYKKFALVRIKMTQPLLKSYPKKGYKINFHPVIREFFDETKHIYITGHAISSAQYLDMQLMERMVWSYEMLTILLEKFIQIKKSIPYVFCNIGKPLMNQLNTHFRPFFKKVTWKTLSIVSDLHKVDHFLDDALWFHKTTMDIMEARFNVPCNKIENSVFIYVSPLTVGHKKLLRQNLAYQEKQLQDLQIISENMEITVVELINRFVLKCKDKRVDQEEKWKWYSKKRIMIKSSSVAEIELDPRNFIHRKYTPKSTSQFAFECMEVYNYFNQQRVEAVATAIRQSLALLNERIRGVVRSKKYKTVLKVGVPIFFTNVILQVPKVRISPSLMEVQMTVNKIVTGAMRIARDLKPWGFYDPHTYVDARALAVEVVEEKSRRKSEYHSLKHQPSVDHKKEKKHSLGGHKREESQMDELSESEVDLPPLKETSPKQFDSEGRTIITLYRAVYSNKDVVRQIVLLQGQFLIIAKEVDGILAKWREALGSELKKTFRVLAEEVYDFINIHTTIMNRPVHNLATVRTQMQCMKEIRDGVTIMQGKFDDLWDRYELLRSGQELFGMEKSDFPTLMDRKKEFNLLQKLYGLYNQVNRVIDGYYNKIWTDVDIEKINEELTDFQNKCRKLPKIMKDWPAFIELKKKIDDFTESCPLLEMMANPSMKDRHWARLETLLKCKFDVESPDFTLGDIMSAPLLKNKDEVEDICISAVKEKDIEAKLKQVQGDWTNVNLQFTHFKNRGELLVKGAETSEIISLIEDSMMVLSSLLSNRYNAPFRKEIQLWCNNLSQTGEILEKWLAVQNLWIYLEAVFVGGDIAKQLPAEAKRFANIDRSWVKLMQRAHEFSSVIDTCVGDDSMSKLLPFLLEQLESCQKSLTGYLEQKRIAFPRFFFCSDPTLLEILGQSSDSHAIQHHLTDVFESIAKLKFSKRERDRVLQMFSKENEKIALSRSFLAQGGVEHWLGSLLKIAKSSLGQIIGACYDFLGDPEFKILKMIEKFPAQIGLLGLQLWWTKESERALRDWKYDPRIFKKTNKYFLNILNVLIDQTTRDLTKVERIKFETLVTIHVHQKDIFEDLTNMKVRNVLDFEWTKQERFYYNDETDDCLVKVTDVEFIYQNEYLGITDRLVITPLTDRCYITLAQAIGLSMGGAPAGPAGTGKTETTKDMGKSLGKYVVVLNCSDQMDVRALARVFKGLAQSGSWGCFDEFNRIELPVLSVAAQQISILLMAKKEKATHFVFSDGDRMKLDPEFGIFITMNPGYAGRQELPENLKINFRSVAMMVPDRQIIMRVKLAACGFRENLVLARKFFVLYKLCEEQLSKQVHYDFGLRNILSVLRTLGAQKRANPVETEDTTLMRVLRDMNVSKLVDEDEPLFVSLIEDLFVGLKLTSSFYKDMQAAIESTCQEMVLTNYPYWNLKVIQAITAPQMFGRLDVATNDWTDGIFSTLWRRALKIKKDEHVWIVLDGPVDAVWIENLNSVLDDNKLLTLANGDRLPMAVNSKLVFEPDNVDNASPATVSRMGMVFLSSSVLPWAPILDGWLKKRKAYERNVWRPIFDKIYQEAYELVSQALAPKMRILEAIYIRQTCDLLDGFIPKAGADESIFEFLVNNDGQWLHWNNRVEDYVYPTDSVPEYATILVPNVDNVRTNYLIETISKQKKAVLLIGEQGTAKTVMIKGYMSKYNPEVHLQKALNFSSATTPNMFQRIIESYVDKRVGFIFGPPYNRSMTVFIDDINMPVVNSWGDQETNEIVRQLMEAGGFYNLEKPGEFNTIQDLQIWEGILTIKGPECEDQEKVLKLWKHECERVLADRFTSEADKEWFMTTLAASVEEFIQVPISQGKIQYLRKPVPFSLKECYFVDFLRDAPEPTGDDDSSEMLEAPKIYEEVPSWAFLKEKLYFYMDAYNETVKGTKMDMVFFHDAMVHLMIISRIIRTARGSALLVEQFPSSRIYGVNNFMEDLKHLYRVAGGKCMGITFIFTDNDIKDEAFLEFLNNILSSGEVANLFTKEENDSMCNDLVMIMKKMYPKRSPTLESLYDFFIQQSRKNLHIVLCFSPVSEKFRSRALKFPGLISGCTIDWFSRWPRSALIEVAHHFLDEFQMVCPTEVKNKTIEFMGQIQDEVADACTQYFERYRRRTYVTPKSFLSFLEGYKHIYAQRFNEIKKLRLQMTTGLNKLAEAAESVVILKAELLEGEKEIAIANAAAEEILKEVMAAAEIAMKVQAEVKVMAENAQALVKDIAKDKKAAEETLERARPALEAAEAALLTIKAADIATVRKLGKPPYLITVIMDAVLVLFNRRIVHPMKIEKEKSFFALNWPESLKVMGDSKFLFNLQNYPKDTITGEMVDLLRPYLRLPTYTYESAKQACGNVAGLLQWTIAMCAFYNVNKEVIPLKANLAALEGKLDKAQKQLAAAEQMKAEKERELKAVQEQADKANRTKQQVLVQWDDVAVLRHIASLKVTSLNNKYFRQDLEDCLSMGRTLLIEDIFEELDPVLDNVLEKNYVKVGTSLKVKLSDKEVDIDKNFKLFITTKMGNPSYSPEISARTSIIDFTVTMKGLEDQLLGRVIMKEKAELELERTSLVTDVTNMKRKMIQLEANLLHKLTTVEGSLVDDESVLEVLNNTQSTAAVVRSKLETAAETEIKINLAREEYRPVAARGSVLSEKSAILTKRIDAIIEYLTHEIFRYISRGLYENHKFMFVLMLALKIDMFKGKVSHEEFQTFIKGGAALNLNAVEPKPQYLWITDMMWLNTIQLSKLEDFEYLPNQLATNEKVWRLWYQRPAPEAEELPDRFEHMDTFRKTLIIRSLCPDRLVLQAQKYVKTALGKRYADAVILNLEELYEESHNRTPMICFLTMGADPTTAIEALAKKMEFALDAISMGQGQEIIARVMMKASMEEV